MVRKLALGALTVALIAINGTAQAYPENARIQSLGSSFIVDDQSDVLRYSAYMNKYSDNVQITFDSPIWGVKSLGEVVNVGVVANRPLMLDNSVEQGAIFYDAATSALQTVDNNISGLATTQNIPHVLLGLNFDKFLLGFDFFWEYSHFRSDVEANPTTGTDTETKVSGNVNNIGGIVSALFDIENMPLAVKFGMGFPSMSAESEVTTTTTVTTDIKSKAGLFMVGGAELGFTTNKLEWTVGADYVHSHFQFENVAGESQNINSYNKLDGYIGFNTPIDESSFVTLLYDFRLKNSGVKPDNTSYTARSTSTNVVSSIIAAGYENNWKDAWKFDNFALRAGLNYVISSTVDHIEGDGDGGTYSSRTKHETVYGQIDPRIGLGIVKKAFSLDVTVYPAQWAGLVNGPEVGTVTASLDF